MAAYLLAVLAGVVTILNPCVLPLVPIVLAVALREGPFGPLALAAGLLVSFTLAALFAATIGFAVGFDPEYIRLGAAVLMVLAGMLMVVAPAKESFARVAAPLANRAAALTERLHLTGNTGLIVTGVLLGIAWTPCVGPTVGAAVGLSAQRETWGQAAVIWALYALGALIPLLALAYGSRQAIIGRKDRLRRAARWAVPALGVVLALVGVMVLTGIDRAVEAMLVAAAPDWLIGFTTRF